MSQKALKVQTNGSKAYKVVSAKHFSRLVMDEYKPRFVQVHDQYGLVEVDDSDDGKIYTIEEIEKLVYKVVPCSWRPPSTDKNGVERQACFTNGNAEGAGSIKELREKSKVPSSIKDDVKAFFRAVKSGCNLSVVSESLVGGIDALQGLDEEYYHELQGAMFNHYKKCKGGDPTLTEEDEVKLHDILYENVLQFTQIDRSLA